MKPTKEMIEAAAQTLASPNPSATSWIRLDASEHTRLRMDAEAALTAVMPLIEAAVSEQIAEAIWNESQIAADAQEKHSPLDWRSTALGGRVVGLQRALDIARSYPEWSKE